MAVYVDPPRQRFQRMIMCHMVADTTEELLAMAKRIGVDSKHIQCAGSATEHFEICRSKRAEAIKAGAVEAAPRDVVRLIRHKRISKEKSHENL